jgi:hypothetical protein
MPAARQEEKLRKRTDRREACDIGERREVRTDGEETDSAQIE